MALTKEGTALGPLRWREGEGQWQGRASENRARTDAADPLSK